MIRPIFALALVAMPLSLAHAQRGGGGGGGGMGGGMGGAGGGGGMGRGGGMGGRGGMEMPQLRFPSANDLKKFNPADLLVDKKKDLKLSENQVATLTTLRDAITARNAAFLAQYDSAQRKYKPDALPGPYGLDDETKKQIKDLRTFIDSLNVRRLVDVTEALAVVTDEAPRHAAAILLVKQEDEYRAKLPMARMNQYHH